MNAADLVAALLALISLTLLHRDVGIVMAWVSNLRGAADLLDAFYQANAAGLMAGQLGATYFIPTLAVPLLLVTHALAFRILLRHPSKPIMSEPRQPGEIVGTQSRLR